MPFAAVNGARLYYRLEGTSGKPVLMLSHSLGADHGQWAPQMADFLEYFQVLRYDTRGHGASEVTPGDYSIEQLARDALGVADALKIAKFAFCGVSLGGMTGQRVGAQAPERLTALVLANASPRSKPMPPMPTWDDRRRAVLDKGMAASLEAAMQRCFSPETLAKGDPYVGSAQATFVATDPLGYAGCGAAIRDMDNLALLGKISTPTLVIAGDRDVATPWAGHGEVLAREIPGARSVRLAAAHWSNMDKPRSFTAAVLEFALEQIDAKRKAGNDPKEAGFAVRRAVLGDAHVDRSIAATTDFTRDFQELITRYAWGTIWTRPGLDRRTRRLLVLAMTASLGRWEEFRLHVRSALTHGMEPCDLKELLLQAAVYTGAPVGNTGFHIATEEMEKLRPQGQS
jgi:3-oxoadipate enol-lactonase/4-carboxymuconolactone decarboxylase